MAHLKRLMAPKTWVIERKTKKWTVKPSPGPHATERSIPLLLLIRDYLNYADTAREAKRIIGEREVMVDGKHQTNPKFPCGFMDVISIPKIEEYYRILLDSKGVLRLTPITAEDAKWKLCKIENKTTIKNGKIQLNLHDGRNIIAEEEYKTGDVLKISLPQQEILDVFPLAKGNLAMIIGGKHAGEIEKIEEIEVTKNPKPNVVKLKGFSTIKPYVFPIGKDKPVVEPPKVSIYE